MPKKSIPKKYKNPIFFRGDSLACPLAFSIDIYGGCDWGCIYCFLRELDSTLFPAYFKGWKEDLVRPSDLSIVKKAFKTAYSEKESDSIIIKSIRAGVPALVGVKSDIFMRNKMDNQLFELLEILDEYDYPFILQTKNCEITKNKVLDAISEMNSAVIISIIPGSAKLLKNLEKHCPNPKQRWATVKRLRNSDIWCGVCAEPIIPTLNDSMQELEAFGLLAADSGVSHINFYNYVTRRRKQAKNRFEALGFNYEKIMKHNKGEYWQKIGQRVFEIFRKYDLKVSCPDWINFPFDSDMECCCGIDRAFEKNFNHFTFMYAMKKIKDKGKVSWSDMEKAPIKLHTTEQYYRMKVVWSEKDPTYYGMFDNPQLKILDYDSEDMPIWGRREIKNLEQYFLR